VSADEHRSWLLPPLPWFRVAELEPGVHLVAEPGHVSCWLVHGSERSLLIDTGLGVRSISDAIEPVASSRVVAVNSHSHFDHVGGNHEFAERLIHEAGRELVVQPVAAELLDAYAGGIPASYAAFETLLVADREAVGFLIGPDEQMRPWPPEGLDVASWRIEPPPPTGLLRDGDVLELGGRQLRAIHTPGHCPDHVCLVDERAGILFAQDMAYYGPHYLNFEGCDVDAWARSERRLAEELAGAIRTIYCAHCLRPSVPPGLLYELADAGEQVAAGEAKLIDGEGFLGERLPVADYGHFSIVLPRA
jgi:glyoxylase-like metal-dependent hydrolase (beta-lactamase superfamily II)